jgi:hypothetical protein
MTQSRPRAGAFLRRLHAPLLLLAALFVAPPGAPPTAVAAVLLVCTLAASAFICHAELCALREAFRRDARYLAAVGMGGVLGLSLLAISAWASLLYPALLVGSALLRPRTDWTEDAEGDFKIAKVPILHDIAAPASGLVIVSLLAPSFHQPGAMSAALFGIVLMFLALFALLSSGQPLRFGLSIAALTVFGAELWR